MSDQETVEEVTSEESTQVEDVVESQDDATDGTDWQAMARKWESRAKADKDDAFKWREYVKSQKSVEEQRLEELEQTKSELERERGARLRYEIASEKQIPADALQLLEGTTRKEIEAKADALLQLLDAQSSTKKPKPDPNQGVRSGGTSTPAEDFAQAFHNIL
jgi:NADPH-dependent glutamate synthase beta subunit-like oxidoreductase